MPNNVNLGSDFVDEGYRQPQRRPMPQREMGNGMGNGMNPGMPSGRASARRKKNQTASIIILSVEIVVFIVLLILFFVLKSKIDSPATSASETVATEAGATEEGQNSGGVNVESDSFTLTCTKVQLANDVNGNPAAVIYFTFVNKTDTPLSMAEVFPPSLTQNGAACAIDAQLAEFPTEYANKDMQVSGGQSVDCCFTFSIGDLTSPLTLTIHDNYSTFTDIGSTEIPIS